MEELSLIYDTTGKDGIQENPDGYFTTGRRIEPAPKKEVRQYRRKTQKQFFNNNIIMSCNFFKRLSKWT